MNKTVSFPQKKEFNSEKLEKDFEALTLKLSLNPSKDIFSLEADIYYFLSENQGLCGQLIHSLNFKDCYFICKKNEKLLMMIFKAMQAFDRPKFQSKEIYNELMDANKDVNSLDYNSVINQVIEKPLKDSVQHEEKPVLFFFEKMVRFLMFSLNNSAAILVLRSKLVNGWQTLIKALFVRFKIMNSLLGMFHVGVIEMNVAYALFLMEKYDFANIFVNRSLKNLEFLAKMERSQAPKEDFLEKKTDFLCIIELLANKNSAAFEDETVASSERLIKLLELGYFFYSNVLEKLNKKADTDFARMKSQSFKKDICNLMPDFEESKKPSSEKKPPESTKKQMLNEDNFSSASFKTVQSSATLENNLLSKENIVFQKYIEVNKTRYKIVMAQINEYSCLEVFLYCKPRHFLKKLFITYDTLLKFAKGLEENVLSDEKSLKTLFKKLAKKLYVRDDELFMKELEFFQNLEDLIKANNIRKT